MDAESPELSPTTTTLHFLSGESAETAVTVFNIPVGAHGLTEVVAPNHIHSVMSIPEAFWLSSSPMASSELPTTDAEGVPGAGSCDAEGKKEGDGTPQYRSKSAYADPERPGRDRRRLPDPLEWTKYFPERRGSERSPLLGTPPTSSIQDGEAPARAAPEMTRTLRWYHLLLLCFFWTCGGPFGIEPAVGAGGPVLTLLGLLAVALFWGVPQAMLSAELSTMIPDNGGNLLWVRRAFGRCAAIQNGYNNLVQAIISNALLIQLVVSYLPPSVELSFAAGAWVMAFFVAVCVVANVAGSTYVGELNLVLLPIIFLPFLIIAGVAHHRGLTPPSHYKEAISFIPEFDQVDWSVLLSTIIWCLDGFDSTGSAAGEVVGGKYAFIAGIMSSFPLALMNYGMPIIVSYAILNDQSAWDQAGFTNVGYAVSSGCGILMVVTSYASVFGQFNSALVPNARVVWAASLPSDPRDRLLPSCISFSISSASGVVRPLAAIVFTALIAFAVALAPFTIVVEAYLYFRVTNLAWEYASLVGLRLKEPNTPRPWRIPGGLPIIALMWVPILVVAGVLLATSRWQSMAVGLGSQLLFLCVYAFRLRQYASTQRNHPWNRRE